MSEKTVMEAQMERRLKIVLAAATLCAGTYTAAGRRGVERADRGCFASAVRDVERYVEDGSVPDAY